MFGGFHIDMEAFKTIGNLLDSSGWTAALVQANVATPGTASSFLCVTYVTRTRRAHQITASSILQLELAVLVFVRAVREGDFKL